MNVVRLDRAPVIPVIAGSLIGAGLLGLFGWWLQWLDKAISAADFGNADD